MTCPTTETLAAGTLRHDLRGTPASRGQVTGPARILHDPQEGDQLRAGEVLVCAVLTPAWTPFLSIAAGVVTEAGGVLASPAIIAREYGIPAVMAVTGATTRIRNDELVSVDGSGGAVSLER